MSLQRALVTGGAGFLGSHFVDALLGEGWNVIVVDNLLTGRRANLEHLSHDPRFEFVELDICEPFDGGKVDYVFHFASPASPVDYSVHGIPTLKVGSLGTFHALDVAHNHGAKYFVSSTSECYGDPLEHPQKETYWGNVNPIGPRSVYDEAKRFTEAVTMAYRRYHNLDTRIVRIFNTYGPRMQLNDGRVVPNFMKQALRGEDLTAYGDGSQTRSFCYVSEEIEPVYRITVQNGSLVLKRLKSKPQQLRPALVDYFDGSNGDLHFERDQSGKISGFLLNSGRIKNFRFRKVADRR